MSSSRQLAAIMFTDIVGYTALMGKDEEKAFALLKKNRQIQKPIIEKYGGKWLKEMGDGVLASFSTVSDAVYCAASIQFASEKEPDLKLRIGIHEGEVVFDSDDVFGDGVNIASRLESLAPEGGIWVSESVSRNIQNKKGIETQFVREEQLKNVKDPVRIYEVNVIGEIPLANKQTIDKGEESSTERNGSGKKFLIVAVGFMVILALAYFLFQYFSIENQAVQVSDVEKSIIVIPFRNLSGDPEQEYFSDGLTDELINQLAAFNDVRVISTTTSLAYKNSEKTTTQIGEELNVSYVLEGSIRKDNNEVRINVQLIDVSKDQSIWSETFTMELSQLFTVQKKISRRIGESLQVMVTLSDDLGLDESSTNPEVIDLYLKVRHNLIKNWSMEAFSENIILLERIISLDENFAPAYAELAGAYIMMGSFIGVLSSEEVLSKINPLIEKAQELQPELAGTHLVKAYANFFYIWDFREAKIEFKRGLDLNPNQPLGQFGLAYLFSVLGESDKALSVATKFGSIDPLSFWLPNMLTEIEWMNGDYAKTVNRLQEYPRSLIIDNALGRIYLMQGMFNKVIDQNEEAFATYGVRPPLMIADLAVAYYKDSQPAVTDELITELEQRKLNGEQGSINFCLSLIYAGIGENGKALESLENAYMEKEEEMIWLKMDPRLKPLHGDPRHEELLRKVGFPD